MEYHSKAKGPVFDISTWPKGTYFVLVFLKTGYVAKLQFTKE
jgi:hypothetical protein